MCDSFPSKQSEAIFSKTHESSKTAIISLFFYVQSYCVEGKSAT